MTSFRLDELTKEAEKRNIEIVLPLDPNHHRLRIEARMSKKGKSKVIDYETVKPKDTVDDAAQRMLKRMRRDGMFV
jgi:hypothetical protein